MRKLLILGNSLFFLASVFWVYFSLYFIFQFFTPDYTNLEPGHATLLLVLTGLLLVSFHCRIFFSNLLKQLLALALTHKWLVLVLVISFQLLLLLTSVGLASADTSHIHDIAVNPILAAQTDYISVNPNNYLLALWMRFNFLIFSENLVVALAAWNMLFIDASIILIYQIGKQLMPKKGANGLFLLTVGIIGFSPQHLYTYSDPITLFGISLFIWLCFLTQKSSSLRLAALSGLVLALTTGFRPPIFIFIIAGTIVLALQCFQEKTIKQKLMIQVLVGLTSFLLLNRGISYSLSHQNMVKYEPDKSRTLLYYVDLGLTYSGNLHADLPIEVVAATGQERHPAALKDIKRRLQDYDRTSFIGHLFYKYYWMTNEGMFGWLQENVLQEENRLNLAWLKTLQDTPFATWIRSFVYRTGKYYPIYGLSMQILWVAISLGLLFYSLFFKADNPYLLWMQITLFGGLLFLMLFEAGRTRYLIQFLPAILLLSSKGWLSLLHKQHR